MPYWIETEFGVRRPGGALSLSQLFVVAQSSVPADRPAHVFIPIIGLLNPGRIAVLDRYLRKPQSRRPGTRGRLRRDVQSLLVIGP